MAAGLEDSGLLREKHAHALAGSTLARHASASYNKRKRRISPHLKTHADI